QNINGQTGTPVCHRFYDPATFNITYDAGSTPPPNNTGIGILTIRDPTIGIADFRDGATRFGLPAVPINIIHVQPQSTDVTGNGEWTLDMTYAQGMAYNVARLDLYTVPTFAFSDLVRAINKWVSD